MTIRGLPGVTTYVDGVWVGTTALWQRDFVDLERIEVLLGPQDALRQEHEPRCDTARHARPASM